MADQFTGTKRVSLASKFNWRKLEATSIMLLVRNGGTHLRNHGVALTTDGRGCGRLFDRCSCQQIAYGDEDIIHINPQQAPGIRARAALAQATIDSV